MPTSRFVHASAYLAAALLLAHCSTPSDDDSPGTGGTAQGSAGLGAGGSGNASVGGTGAAPATGGTTSVGGTAGAGTTATGGSSASSGGSSGGTPSSAGSPATGGTTQAGGSPSTGGSLSAGGMSATGGSGAMGGMPATGGSLSTGGMGTAGSGTAGMGPVVDGGGQPLAKAGDEKNGTREYLNLGDIRLLNNMWGSEALGCSGSMYKVYVNSDKSIGWDFNRPTCGGNAEKPDYPEIEFGVHPFGQGSSLATSPDYSSTALLPQQIKSITSASVTLDNLSISLQNAQSWNINTEFWLSERNPITDPNPGVYAEIIVFWGWQNGRWPDPPNGMGPTGNGAGDQVTAGAKTYKLTVQDDSWADGWRYFQFRANDGPQTNFNGKVDFKPFLDYLVNQRGYSSDLWITRFEVGSEIDDNTSGSVKINNVAFEVNGTSKSIELAE